METPDDIIKISAIGLFKRSDCAAFAVYIGYKDTVEIPPAVEGEMSTVGPNPQTHIEYIEAYIKAILADKLAEMNIKIQEQLLREQFASQMVGMQQLVLTNINQSISTTSEVVPLEPEL